MLTYLRYILATFCFAASVGCLPLWWRSYGLSDRFGVTIPGIETREFAAWTDLPSVFPRKSAVQHGSLLSS